MSIHYTSITRRVTIIAAAVALIILLVNLNGNSAQDPQDDEPKMFKRQIPAKWWPEHRNLECEKQRVINYLERFSDRHTVRRVNGPIICVGCDLEEWTESAVKIRILFNNTDEYYEKHERLSLQITTEILRFFNEWGLDPQKEKLVIEVVPALIFGRAVFDWKEGHKIGWKDQRW